MKINEFKKKYYFIQNIYTLNSYLEFNKEKKIRYNSDQIDLINNLLDNRYFQKEENNEITFELKKIENNKDCYKININFKNIISIEYCNYRSLRYAMKVINDLVDENKDNYLLPVCLIVDNASFINRGIIEGYYGEPWTYENRLDMINFMDEFRLNTYMYAPKCDEYHREKWFELYPNTEIEKFKTLVDEMNKKDIDFYYCISPGHHKENEEGFIYSGNKDFNRLFIKLDQLIALGINNYGLFLDDIDYNLKGDNLKIFKRPGIAHAHICNRVYEYLKSKVENLKFVMCPTEYHQIGDSVYRTDLRENLNNNIEVFWTGDNVCAEIITDEQTIETKKAFNKKIQLWENFPVTDFTYGVRQYMAPIQNRSINLSNYIEGFLINPMIYYEISKVAMITEAHYAWNSPKYDENTSFDLALKYFGTDFYNSSFDYIYFNYPNVLSYGMLSLEKEIVNDDKEIISYYKKVSDSVRKMLKLDLPIIKELKPWLDRVLKEEEIVNDIVNGNINKDSIIELLSNIKFSGSELFDYLIQSKKLLTEEEYNTLIKKRRGNPWYRVWEHKRFSK